MSTDMSLSQQLEKAFYATPTPGFQARMAVLFTINAVSVRVPFLSILHPLGPEEGEISLFFAGPLFSD